MAVTVHRGIYRTIELGPWRPGAVALPTVTRMGPVAGGHRSVNGAAFPPDTWSGSDRLGAVAA
ncbi:hypothetical protein Sar04_35900 [Salinispora arenicola]|uniref:Uncharacterized protein n=1 Tax=Salinispora arenicola TaxID=168697 RepID=A0ABQ4JV80_SALAC|nr:hypothetical protein Sar04_35900 [Salinispora arenicola]